MFKIFKKTVASGGHWTRSWSPVGVVLSKQGGTGAAPVDDPLFDGYLTQLSDEGLAVETDDGFLIGWDGLYGALGQPAYAALPQLLSLPSTTSARPILRSSGSLTDAAFSISLTGWQDAVRGRFDCELQGAVMQRDGETELMAGSQWELFKEVVVFARRPEEGRSDLAQRQAWGRIRKLALAAEARLDDFLYRSVVLSPERLEIGLRRSDAVLDDRVVEIEPGFEGAPKDWLDAFDRERTVRDRYDIVTPEGIVQVLVTPKVRTVLHEIKRLEGRRVAGSRAEAFLLNPYATLGDDAVDVIVESQFEKAREEAGLNYERFTPTFQRDAFGYPLQVGLLIETASSNGPVSSDTQWLDDETLTKFTRLLENALKRGHQLIAWEGFDLEVQGDADRQLAELREALARRKAPPTLVSYAQVHDLSGYSSRVEGIGVEKPYYSAYIAKKQEGEGWFPENVFPVVVYQPKDAKDPIAVPTNRPAIDQLAKDVSAAKAAGDATVNVPWLPQPITVAEAEEISDTFDKVFEDIEDKGTFERPKPPRVPGQTLGPRKQLVLRANIQALEYEEQRREALQDVPVKPQLPSSISPGYSLLPHQLAGLAWMQHLFGLQAEYQVRGAVLADDMGLGKTFQLLALMAWMRERNPDVEPMLVVAPVSLLENWASEAEKFFVKGALPLLTAYGEGLREMRVPRAQIDQRLLSEDGLVRFLKPNWVGSAKVVLTTYETLRDLEFSFAAQCYDPR